MHSLISSNLLSLIVCVLPSAGRSFVVQNGQDNGSLLGILGARWSTQPSNIVRDLTVTKVKSTSEGAETITDTKVATGKYAATAVVSLDGAPDSSFEDAQVIGQNLATILSKSCANGEPMSKEATATLRALVSTTSGARGWFVSLLTNADYEPVFQTPVDETLLAALCDNPEPNIKLMTMNVAMSTATELTHLSNGNPDLASGSKMTSRRATVLVAELLDRLPGMRESMEALLSAVDGRDDGDKEWIKFCMKWGYGPDQKAAIRDKIEPLLKLPSL